MFQIALTLAVIPQVLVYALLLAALLASLFRGAFRHPLAGAFHAVSAGAVGDWSRCCDRDVRRVMEPGSLSPLPPGSTVVLRHRWSLPLRLFALRVRTFFRGVGLAVAVAVVALLAAIGLYILVGGATALLTPRMPIAVERGA